MKTFNFLFVILGIFVNAQFTKVMDFTNINAPSPHNYIDEYNTYNGKVFFTRLNATTSLTLHVSDGTISGTKSILDIPHNTYGKKATVSVFKKAGNGIYFVVLAFDSVTNANTEELWFTDGTAENTRKLLDNTFIHIDGRSLDPSSDYRQYQPSHIGSTFYFWKSSGDQVAKYFLWSSDGTVDGTRPVSGTHSVSIPEGTNQISENFDFGTVLKGNYYFIGRDVTAGGGINSLYKLNNGLPELIVELRDINTIGRVFKNKLYFDATYLNDIGHETMDYFVSDGTSSGTKVFKFNSDGAVVYTTDNYTYKVAGDYMFLMKVKSGKNYLYATKGQVDDVVKLIDDVPGAMFYGDENRVFLVRNSGDNDLLKSYAINLSNLSVQEITKPFYNMFGGYVLNGTLWIPSKANYRDSMLQVWRSGGDNATTTVVPNSFSHPNQFFALNTELFAFSNYLNFMNLSLYKFGNDFTFTNTSGDNKWETANNWKTKVPPLDFDNATIPEGFTPSISSNVSVKNIELFSPLNINSGSLNVNGSLFLFNKLILSESSLNLKGVSSQILNANSSNYVVTKNNSFVSVENIGASRGLTTVPIGMDNFYNPVSINNLGVTDKFTFNVVEGIQNATNGAINATWNISEDNPGGSNVTLTLGWDFAQHNSSFDLNAAKIGHFKNGGWEEENTGSVSVSDIYSLSATGINSFSPFSVMNFSNLSTSSNLKEQHIIIPNPFKENLVLYLDYDEVQFTMYDVTGKIVVKSVLRKGKNNLIVSSLRTGMYFYQIKDHQQKILKTGKLIKE